MEPMSIKEIYKDYFKHLQDEHPLIYEKFKRDYYRWV